MSFDYYAFQANRIPRITKNEVVWNDCKFIFFRIKIALNDFRMHKKSNILFMYGIQLAASSWNSEFDREVISHGKAEIRKLLKIEHSQ